MNLSELTERVRRHVDDEFSQFLRGLGLSARELDEVFGGLGRGLAVSSARHRLGLVGVRDLIGESTDSEAMVERYSLAGTEIASAAIRVSDRGQVRHGS